MFCQVSVIHVCVSVCFVTAACRRSPAKCLVNRVNEGGGAAWQPMPGSANGKLSSSNKKLGKCQRCDALKDSCKC